MRFWFWLSLLAAFGVVSPASAVMIDGGGDDGITFQASYRDLGDRGVAQPANPIDDFVYAGAINGGLPYDPDVAATSATAISARLPLVSLTGAFSTAPEPGVWLMLVGGFGLIGFTMRRRRAVPTLGHAQII